MHTDEKSWPGTLKSYIFGLIASLVLTFAAYIIIVEKLLPSWYAVAAIVFLGVLQAVIQLLYFLHLGKEDKPYWNLHMFFNMISIVATIVVGSMWIMYSLNERVMPPMGK